MRGTALALSIALAACGQKESAPRDAAAKPPADAAPLGVGGLAGRIPRLTVDAPTLALATPPPVAVVIDKDGAIRVVATGGEWTRVVAPGFASREPVLAGSIAVQDAILAIAKQAGADTDDLASDLAETRAEEAGQSHDAGTIGHGSGESGYGWGGTVTYDIDMAITYAAAPGEELPPTTPLLIVAPEVPGAQLAGTLDDVGGVVLVDDDGLLRVLSAQFPWASAAGGGAEIEEGADEPALDVVAGKAGVALVPGPQAELVAWPLAALKDAIARRQQGAVVTDVLVALTATAQHLADALAALDAAGAPRLGVGERPVPMQGFDPLGKPLDPRVRTARTSQVILAPIAASDGLDPATIKRYFRRHIAKYQYCYDKVRLAKPDLKGTVAITLTINPLGAVTQVDATGVDAEVEACMESVARATQFPSPKDAATVKATTSFTLRPEEPEPPPLPTGPPNDPPRVERGAARVVGGVSTEIIARGLQRSDAAFRKCLQERLKRDPSFRDAADVELTIGPDGQVIHVRAVATHRELARCIEDALIHREFKDPSADDITNVELTLTFQ